MKTLARERLQVVGVVVPLNAGPSSHKILERDGLGARGVTISHNYRLATLTIRPTPVGSNRRQLSCISIRRGPRNIDFLPAIFMRQSVISNDCGSLSKARSSDGGQRLSW